MDNTKEQIIQIPVSQLQQHQENKKYFHDITGDDFDTLVQSIASHGILTPLLVAAGGGGEAYTVLSGHQRLRAAVELLWSTVPCLVVDPKDPLQTLLHANIGRRLTLSEKFRLAAHVMDHTEDRRAGNGDKGGENSDSGQKDQNRPRREQIAKEAGISINDVKIVNKIKVLPPREQEELWDWLDSENPNRKTIIKRLKQANEDKRKYKESDKELNQLKRKAKLASELQHAADQIQTPEDYRDGQAIEALGSELATLRIACCEAFGRLKAIKVPSSPMVYTWAQQEAAQIVDLLHQQATQIASHFAIDCPIYDEVAGETDDYPTSISGPPVGSVGNILAYEGEDEND